MADNNTTAEDDTSSSQPIQFALLLIVEIPAIPCTIFILFYLLQHWHTMISKALRKHAVLLLTIISWFYIILDLPLTINSYRLGYDSPRTPSFCRWWYWIDDTLIITSLFLAAVASVQRHILILNAHWLHFNRVRVVCHYIPLIICVLYPPIFYLIVIYFYPCENSMDEYIQYCAVPCYSLDIVLFNIDWTMNTMIPICILIIANIGLVNRVIRSLRKFHRRQSLVWKRQRKLTLELLIISSLYAIGWGPSTILAVIQQLYLPNVTNGIPILSYLDYFSYFVCPLQPFICLTILPELVRLIKRCLRRVLTRSIVTPEVVVLCTYPL
jgi:hypothetical protein